MARGTLAGWEGGTMSEHKLFSGFLSYSHHDADTDPGIFEAFTRDLERRINAKLANARFKIWRDIEGIRTGNKWHATIEAALLRADVLIVLLSPRWIESTFCRNEYSFFEEKVESKITVGEYVAPILIRSLDGQKDFLTSEQYEVYASITKRQYFKAYATDFLRLGSAQRVAEIDLLADNITGMIQRLRDPSVKADNSGAPSVPPAFPGEISLSNIRIALPLHFMDSDKVLAAIETALQRNEGRAAVTVLHGMRGVGKTTLAVAYAEYHRRDYRTTWWIRAHSKSTLRGDLVGLGIQLGWVDAGEKEEPAVEAVMKRLRHEGKRLLLIFDNANDADALEPYLPRGGAAHVLVTSNAHVWRKVAEPVEIRPWRKDTGADYLIARTGREAERTAAETLSEALGGLPLAHEQAAAYCEHFTISFAEYSKRLEVRGVKILDDKRFAPAEYHPEYYAEHLYRLTVAKTFGLAIEGAAELHPGAEPLIVYAALLAPDPIPLFLFAEAREKLAVAPMLAGDGLDEAVAALHTFALVDRETIVDEREVSIKTGAIRLHRLVRWIAARRLGKSRNRLRRALVAALTAVYPSDGIENPSSWPRCASLTPHLISICETEMADAAATAECADLLNRAGEYFYVRGAYPQARSLVDRALAIREKVLGDEHPATAGSVYLLARLLQDQGKLVEARPLYERALAIQEKVLGPEHPDTARVHHYLGRLLGDQYDLVGAQEHYERALAIREKVLGPEHPDTARTLQNLALVLQDQGRLVKALQFFQRARKIQEKMLGPEHPDTATLLHNLGRLLRDQGDFEMARPLFERAVAIQEKVLGPNHPRTAISLNNLGRLLWIQGEFKGARRLQERVFAIREEVLGPEHPDTARSLQNLALVLQDQGEDLEKVRPLFERALAIQEQEKVLGPEHPNTAELLHQLACLLRDHGELETARPLFERALAIREKKRGPNHPETATSLSDLARLLSKSGHTGDAKALFERALAIGVQAIAIAEKELGPGHPLTQRYYSQHARLCLDTGRAAEAMSLGQAALAIHETTWGLDHPWTKYSARVTADALDALGPRRPS
jgi:tetratricopeptide (TPR) repeat protein